MTLMDWVLFVWLVGFVVGSMLLVLVAIQWAWRHALWIVGGMIALAIYKGMKRSEREGEIA
jgi:MFS family permease